jgi:PAS domain S-box-containing protein/putative nucleotidyltransferase with HDIG domain
MAEDKMKVVLIEDNPDDVAFLQDTLAEMPFIKWELVHFSRLQEAQQQLQNGGVQADVILLDLGLPDSQGPETFHQVRPLVQGIPIVVLSGLDDRELALNLVREGAQDYLVKGLVNGELLLRTMRYSIERLKTEEELRQARDELGARVKERTAGLEKALRELRREISERRQAQEALEKSEALYRLLAENVRDVIWTTDLDLRFTYVSPSIRLLTGHSPEEYRALSLERILTPASQEVARKLLSEELAAEEGRGGEDSPIRTKVVELEFLKQDGAAVWAEVSADFLRDGRGKPVGILGVTRDSTARREAAAALRESEARFRHLFDQASDGFFVVSAENHFLDANAQGLAMLGYTRDELLQMNVADVLVRTERPRLDVEPKLMMAGQPHLAEWEHLRQDGSVFMGEVSARKLNVQSYLAIVRDLTERKQAEEKLLAAMVGSINSLAAAIEMRDPYTSGHQRGVAELACAMAREMGPDGERIRGIELGGILHDIGKISVPAEILAKPGKISDSEVAIIRQHPQRGYEILKTLESPWPLREMVLQHHERLDGSGYPSGLKEGEIVLEAKILAVADVVEAMASHRPYRPARGIDQALEEITRNKGVLYDPAVVEVCLKLFQVQGFKFR